MNSRLR